MTKQGKEEGRSVEATSIVCVVSFLFPHSFFVELITRDRTETTAVNRKKFRVVSAVDAG